MNCPNCGARCTGRVGADQYYCWECCVEFRINGGIQIYHLNLEGDLIAVAAPAESVAGPACGNPAGTAAGAG